MRLGIWVAATAVVLWTAVLMTPMPGLVRSAQPESLQRFGGSDCSVGCAELHATLQGMERYGAPRRNQSSMAVSMSDIVAPVSNMSLAVGHAREMDSFIRSDERATLSFAQEQLIEACIRGDFGDSDFSDVMSGSSASNEIGARVDDGGAAREEAFVTVLANIEQIGEGAEWADFDEETRGARTRFAVRSSCAKRAYQRLFGETMHAGLARARKMATLRTSLRAEVGRIPSVIAAQQRVQVCYEEPGEHIIGSRVESWCRPAEEELAMAQERARLALVGSSAEGYRRLRSKSVKVDRGAIGICEAWWGVRGLNPM